MKKISKETIIRTILLVVTLVNTVLTTFGANPIPFSDTQIYQAISSVCTIAATVWAWWKNNSFTSAAIKADEYMNALKHQEKKEDPKEGSSEGKEDELK